jgi:tetratricopeptide (TPR) repeat protein
LLLADTARLSQHPAQAVAAFEVILSKHARDERASLAALSLGRVELDQRKRPKEAAAAFERALELGLPVGLLEDAHARRVQALAQAGLHDRAMAAAAEYFKRFPQGRRRADVERWAAQP